ncbi:DUF4402 domain-containing protein [Sneathiella marina]|uniref:DUF4402 domain-containing protein n=1 Tax=Sneathiella marina TaxID=2950108 RepID=A0ABY4VXV2_9PROT|nr:DUF4402 domain-containing protein [Sneathiella marina]USG59751.1 DUF4402 domain-containing protein [Sneathiella marina]
MKSWARKYPIRVCGLLILSLGFGASALAGEATDNPVAIKLLKSLGIEEITKMNLGGVVLDGVGGFDTLAFYSSSSGHLAKFEYSDELNYSARPKIGTRQLGEIKITGTPGATVTFSVEKGANLSNGKGDILKIREMYRTPFSDEGTLDSNGVLIITTGIELEYSGKPALGTYTGSYTVTANYP